MLGKVEREEILEKLKSILKPIGAAFGRVARSAALDPDFLGSIPGQNPIARAAMAADTLTYIC